MSTSKASNSPITSPRPTRMPNHLDPQRAPRPQADLVNWARCAWALLASRPRRRGCAEPTSRSRHLAGTLAGARLLRRLVRATDRERSQIRLLITRLRGEYGA